MKPHIKLWTSGGVLFNPASKNNYWVWGNSKPTQAWHLSRHANALTISCVVHKYWREESHKKSILPRYRWNSKGFEEGTQMKPKLSFLFMGCGNLTIHTNHSTFFRMGDRYGSILWGYISSKGSEKQELSGSWGARGENLPPSGQ